MRKNLVLFNGKPCKVTRINADTVCLSYLNEDKVALSVPVDKISPIPLSVEIMEKNFHGVTRGSGSMMSHEYDLNEDYFISADAGDFYLCIRVDDSEYGYHDVIYLKELKWLHQLQQIFTICGIEQEITLDGISVKEGGC